MKDRQVYQYCYHELTGLDVVTAAAVFDTQKGPTMGVFVNMRQRKIHPSCLTDGMVHLKGS